jgi:hypothetical protein
VKTKHSIFIYLHPVDLQVRCHRNWPFRSSLRRGQLLSCLVDRTFAGKGEQTTEYGIGR